MAFNVAFTIANFLAIAFILLPATWHWRVGNTGTLILMFWLLVTVVPQAINSAIWFDTVDNVAPYWCDITTKLRVGADVGVTAASLCITRQLESIAAARQVHYTSEDKRRRKMIDLALGFGLPLLVMVLHVVVQGHRYDIIERVGCTRTYYWSIPAIFIITIWPVVLLSASAFYAGVTIRLFVARRYQFSRLLESSKSALTTGRFIRLVALAGTQILLNLPLVLFAFIYSIASQSVPSYPGWAAVHDGFYQTPSVSVEEWSLVPFRQLLEVQYWTPAATCALFFIFFGLGEESVVIYKGWLHSLGVGTRIRNSGTSSPTATRISLPPLGTSHEMTEGVKASHVEKSGEQGLAYDGVVVTVQEDNFSSV